jgi:hypothetical protein
VLLVHRLVRRSASEVGILDEARIRVKPVSVSQCQKSPCQLVSMLIHRLRQPARSKEQGNSFAGGQGADFHSPCTPGRERTATSTPSRLTFAVNKIRVNPWLSCLKSLCICFLCAFCGRGVFSFWAEGGLVRRRRNRESSIECPLTNYPIH